MAEYPAPSEGFGDDTRGKLVESLSGELKQAFAAALAAGGDPRALTRTMEERRRVIRAMRDGDQFLETGPPDIFRPRRPNLRVAATRRRWLRENAAMAAGMFVGRDRELGLLRGFLAQAAEGRAVTAILGGEAGVGKSRLLDEFAATAAAEGANVLRGSCIELGGGGFIPYAPLIEALRLMVRSCGEDEARRLVGPAWAELAGLIADFTGSEAPAAAPGAAPRSQLHVFGAVLRMLDHLGERAPVILIFEDLHWADPSTLDLVSYLTRTKSTERALLVCSHRTDLPPGHPLRALLTEPEFTRRTSPLALPRFTEPELRRFLDGLGPVGRDAFRRGFELSGGNAFFAEQLMVSGALNDRGANRLPESLAQLMLLRIRVLSQDATRVMRVAATAARRVDDGLLADVCGLGDEALEEALRECLAQGMLIADPDDDTYVVRHALLRDAVYESLVPRERRRLHTEMAEAITADAALNPAENMSAAVELAHHWYHANRYADALRAALHAGEMTARMRAFREAETQNERALALWEKVPEAQRPPGVTHVRMLTAAADAARWAGHSTKAVGHIQRAIAQMDAVADARRAGEMYERLGSYQWEAGASEESVAAYLEAERLLAASGAPTAFDARVQAALATARLRTGRYTEGLAQARRAVRLAGDVGAEAERGRALNTAGIALTLLGRADEGVGLLREALMIAERADHLEDLLRAYSNLGMALEHTGDLAGAVATAREGLRRASRLGLTASRQAGVLANNAGAALLLLGWWDEAAQLLREVLLDRPPVGESAYLRLTLAEIEVARGNFEEAERLIDEVRDRPNSDPRYLGALHVCQAELSIWRDAPGIAQAAVDRGLAAIGGAENVLVHLRLCSVGLRAAADRRRHDPDGTDAAARTGELHARAELAAADRPESREVAALSALCAAERDRAFDAATPEMWEQVATRWDVLGRPYPAAYARWRQAEACVEAGDRAGAAHAARQASETAARLRAAPLWAAVGKLDAAHEFPEHGDGAAAPADGRHDPGAAAAAPTGPAAGAAGPSGNRWGLTERQLDVYRLLVEGLSNRQIAEALVIAESTAGRHVYDVLRKLNVRSRTAAVKLAHLDHVPDLGTPAVRPNAEP